MGIGQPEPFEHALHAAILTPAAMQRVEADIGANLGQTQEQVAPDLAPEARNLVEGTGRRGDTFERIEQRPRRDIQLHALDARGRAVAIDIGNEVGAVEDDLQRLSRGARVPRHRRGKEGQRLRPARRLDVIGFEFQRTGIGAPGPLAFPHHFQRMADVQMRVGTVR